MKHYLEENRPHHFSSDAEAQEALLTFLKLHFPEYQVTKNSDLGAIVSNLRAKCWVSVLENGTCMLLSGEIIMSGWSRMLFSGILGAFIHGAITDSLSEITAFENEIRSVLVSDFGYKEAKLPIQKVNLKNQLSRAGLLFIGLIASVIGIFSAIGVLVVLSGESSGGLTFAGSLLVGSIIVAYLSFKGRFRLLSRWERA